MSVPSSFVHCIVCPSSFVLIQWTNKGQKIQWTKEEGQSIHWTKEGPDNTMDKGRKTDKTMDKRRKTLLLLSIVLSGPSSFVHCIV
jgi:hypothetical protein